MPWSILLGAASSALGLELLGPAAKTVELLGLAASPVALFTIGAVLARASAPRNQRADGREPGHTQPRPHPQWGQITVIALLKLFLHPLLVLLAGTIAIQLGFALSPFALTVIVLVAALPSASNVSLLAEKFGADNGRIARIILVSTAVAFFSFSGTAALLL
jgi:predicted permease